MVKERKTGIEIIVKEFWMTNGKSQTDFKVIMAHRPIGVDPSDPNNVSPDEEYMKDMNWFSNMSNADVYKEAVKYANIGMRDYAKQHNTEVDITKQVNITTRKFAAPIN